MHFNFLSAPVTAQCHTHYQASHQPARPSFLYQKEMRMKVASGTGNTYYAWIHILWILVCERIMKILICPQCSDNSLISISIALQNSLVGGRTLWLPLAVVAEVVLAMLAGLVWWLNATPCLLPSCQKLKSSKVFCGSCYFGHFSPSNIEIWCVFWKRQLPLIQQACFHYKQTSHNRAGAHAALCLLALTVVPQGSREVESKCQCLQPAALAPAWRQPPSKPSGPRGPVQIPRHMSASPTRAWTNEGGEWWSTAGWGSQLWQQPREARERAGGGGWKQWGMEGGALQGKPPGR